MNMNSVQKKCSGDTERSFNNSYQSALKNVVQSDVRRNKVLG